MQRILVAAAALVLGATAASADGRRGSGDDIDRRQYNQAKRIEQGIRSGQLNRLEADRLRAEQDRIRALEGLAKRDGRLDPYERARIAAAQREASRRIYVEKHDRETRGSGWGNWRRWNRWY